MKIFNSTFRWLTAPENRRKLTACLALWWCFIFLGTHIPLESLPIEMKPGLDKVVHFLMYAPLAFLLGARLRLKKQRQFWGALGILLVYGAFDELSQIPVNRSAEFLDWVLDAVGSVFGLRGYLRLQR